ncbi:hypothetical protein [Myxococcus sp. CA040A]|uniref:hypothetical protein n=1 Tax=Myxococcus sp. CA040A TaxID=2741738 RepID=UPI00157AC88E|nr:hypothetical protein [Myxococcus sp. CA040A]NTX03735.1 hypothetical protein [Myxococcus sp. CA040A]
MAAVESRGPQDTERWLCAGLTLARQEGLEAESLATSVPWLLATLAETPTLPPPALVADLGRLVAGHPLAPSLPIPDTLPRLRAAVRAYDDHVLARLAAEPHLEAVSAALARLPEPLRPRGVAFLVARLLSRMGFTAGTSVSPALARRVLERPPGELLSSGYTSLREPGPALEQLAQGYESLSTGARRASALLGDAEAFTLENLEHLQGKAQRLALEQAVEAAEALSRALPPRLRARPVSTGPAPTALEDDAAFPQGGFSSVSNVGSLENLVTSELVYMEDEPTLDLFDVRYVEGELLYYTRDESLAVRRRRVVTFVLPPSLADARVKDTGVRWQRAVVAMGLVLCLVRRLSVWLGDQELRFQVAFPWDGDGPHPLEAERGLCELLLREWRARGTAEILTPRDSDEVLANAAVQAKRARVDVLLLDATRQTRLDTTKVPARVGMHHLDLSEPSPRLHVPGRGTSSPAREIPEVGAEGGPPETPWEAWTGTTLELARGLL